MGQLFSRLLGHLYTPPPTPPLLNLPVELLMLIVPHLSSSPESIITLSLTCRSLFVVLRSHVASLRGHQCRSSLLALLEKDLGDRFYYCSKCCQLHRFSASWNPIGTEITEHYKDIRHHRFHWGPGQLFNPNPTNSRYKLYYVHARLVMNRHLYGSPNGLPLKSLSRSNTWARSRKGGPMWRENSSARIIDDELFLRVKRTLEGRAATLRDAIDEGKYHVCNHVAAGPSNRFHRRIQELTETEQQQDSEAGRTSRAASVFGQPFRTCRDVLGFCTVCLTDYSTTIERAEVRETYEDMKIVPVVDGWRVEITSYHGLGRCRDMEDWRWVTLVGGGTVSGSRPHSGRCMDLDPPGVVMQTWLSFEDNKLEEL